MVTQFNRKDLIEFGQYLLSPERRERFSNHPQLGPETLEQRLSNVNHADIENFIFAKEQRSLKKMSFAKAIANLDIGRHVTLDSCKGDWYLYKPSGHNIRFVNCESGDSEEYSPSPEHLNSNNWVVY